MEGPPIAGTTALLGAVPPGPAVGEEPLQTSTWHRARRVWRIGVEFNARRWARLLGIEDASGRRILGS